MQNKFLKKSYIFCPFNLFLFFGKHNIKVIVKQTADIGMVYNNTYMVVSDSFDAAPLITSINLHAHDL